MSEVNKLMGNSEIQKEETVCALMDGVLLLANASQELKHQQRESWWDHNSIQIIDIFAVHQIQWQLNCLEMISQRLLKTQTG